MNNPVNLIEKPVSLVSDPDYHIQPKLGDVVIPLAGEHLGAHALVCNHPDVEEGYIYIGYHVSGTKVPGDFESLSCSGGPFNDIAKVELTHIGTKQQSFYDSRKILATNRDERYEKFEETVNVWTYWPIVTTETSLRRRYATYTDYLADEQRFEEIRSAYVRECKDFEYDANKIDKRSIKRMKHEVVNHRQRYCYSADKIAIAMFNAYAANTKITLLKYRFPNQGYYVKNEQLGIFLDTEQDFYNLIEAYGIHDAIFDEEIGAYRFSPNIKTDTWAKPKIVNTTHLV